MRKSMWGSSHFLGLFISVLFVFVSGCAEQKYDPNVVDEAKAAGKTIDDYPTHRWNNFKDMDGGVALSPEEIEGRNTWLMWGGGNQAFWNFLARHSYGLVDLLKLLDKRHVMRADRLRTQGMINEPGFKEATQPDQYGLYLDRLVDTNSYIDTSVHQNYWTGKNPPTDPNQPWPPDPNVYGYGSGVIGLRLFPNPNFDEQAKKKWDAERYITDETYYKDPNLVRPYRVSMSCSFCHVAFDPTNSPADPTRPEWANLSSNIGNQYFRFGQVFGYDMDDKSLLWHLVNSPRPGTLDTSLIATDGNNNPNTMNSVFNLGARLAVSKRIKPETAPEDALNMPVLQGLGLPDGASRQVPHILADGADSIGARGALCRVWVNIGEFHEEWIQHINVMIGIRPQTPFKIAKAQKDSVFWNVTQQRSQNLGLFFLGATAPKYLKDAPGGEALIDEAQLDRGKTVFAENCFVCHSSKQPDRFWKNPTDWRHWIKDPDYLDWARQEVMKTDFLENNYLSTDQRYKVTDIGTNASRAFADNGKAGRVWESFSSDDFKNQPLITEPIKLYHPYTGEEFEWTVTDDVGPGRYRPLTLTSIWATAPLFHNNAVGSYPAGHDPRQGQNPDVSVAGRLKVFDDSVEKFLWPEKRDGFNSIYRTNADSGVRIPKVIVPDFARMQFGIPQWLLITILAGLIALGIWIFLKGLKRIKQGSGSWLRNVGAIVIGLTVALGVRALWKKDDYTLGHIPAGTPISLLLNINGPGYLESPQRKELLVKIIKDLITVDKRKLPSLDHPDVPDLVPNLLELNKSPDFLEDRGHYFGTAYAAYKLDPKTGRYVGIGEKTGVNDDDRRALIEFLKTF